MKPIRCSRLAAAALHAAACLALLTTSTARAADDQIELSVGSPFIAALQIDPLRHAAVLDDGRMKTFETLAREKVKLVNASAARRADAVITYLDMMLAPEHHHHASSIFLRKQPFRTELVQLVRQLTPPQDRQGELAEAKLDRVVETGLVSAAFLDTPQVREALSRLERDLMRTAKDAQSVRTARAFADAGMLLSYWRVIPAPQGDRMAAWHSPGELMGRGGAPADDTHAGMSGRGAIAGLAPEVAGKILAAWNELSRAWRFQDAPAASSAATTLAGLLRQVNPAIYPSTGRLDWETWYQRNYKMTWVWIIYMGALPFLLMAIVYKGAWARRIGLALFLGGFALHTFAIGLR